MGKASDKKCLLLDERMFTPKNPLVRPQVLTDGLKIKIPTKVQD